MATAARTKREKPAPTAIEIARKALREKELGVLHYKRSDNALTELRKVVGVGESVDLGGGKKVTIVDRFAEKSQVFHGSFCRRFELEVEQA